MNRISIAFTCLGYDKRNQEHYTAYRSPDLKGYLPARIEGQGENKTFTVRLQEEEGGPVKEFRYSLVQGRARCFESQRAERLRNSADARR